MTSSLSLSILLNAKDGISPVISGIASSFGGLKAGPLAVVVALGAATVAIGATAEKMAADYQQSMNMVKAETGTSTTQMAIFSDQVKSLAVATGVGPTALTKGLYNVLSASFKGKDAMNVLTLATKDSVIGMTDAATTSNALTKVLTSFSVPAKNFNAVNGEMLKTVTAGSMSMSDYASAIAHTSSVAVQYHDSMENMNAVLATLTSSGIKNANIAGTDYNNLLKVLNGNTKSVADKSHALNPAFDETAFAAMNVADKVNYLNKMIIQHGHNLTEIIGKQANAAAAFYALANHTSVYAANLKSLSDQQDNAKMTQEEWNTTSQGFNVTLARLSAATQVLMINLGSKLLPVLTDLLNATLPLIVRFTDWAVKNKVVEKAIAGVETAIRFVASAIGIAISAVQSIIAWYERWKAPIDATATAILVFFIPALIKAGIQAGISGASIAADFIATMVKAGIQSAITALQVTGDFVASMIAAGTQAWIQGPRIIASFVASMITTGARAIATAAIVTGQFVASLVMAGVRAVATGTVMLTSLIPAIVATATSALAAAVTAIPALVVSFAAWAIGAGAAAVATIAATWPILLIIAAIALLVVGIILLVTHWSAVSAWLQSAWVAVATFAATTWNNVATAIQTGFGRAVGFVKNIWSQISGFFSNAASEAVQFGAAIIQGLINGIMSMVGAVGNAASNIMNTIKQYIGAHSPTEKGPGRELNLWGPALVRTFSNDIQSSSPQARRAAENMMLQISQAVKAYPAEISQAYTDGNKVQEAALKKQLSMAQAQSTIYKNLIREEGYTYNQYDPNNPINFAGKKTATNAKYSANGLAPVYGSATSAATTSTSNTATTSSGGSTYIVINNNFNLPKGTSIFTAREIVDIVDKQLAARMRRQASMTTTTSGGMSA